MGKYRAEHPRLPATEVSASQERRIRKAFREAKVVRHAADRLLVNRYGENYRQLMWQELEELSAEMRGETRREPPKPTPTPLTPEEQAIADKYLAQFRSPQAQVQRMLDEDCPGPTRFARPSRSSRSNGNQRTGCAG